MPTFYVARAKKSFKLHPGGSSVYDFPKRAYLTQTKGFQKGFDTARLFPTEGKARQNIKVNSMVVNVDLEEFFEIIPVVVPEPA